MDESGEKFRVGRFGRVVVITSQFIVNDDLGAFTRITPRLRRQATASAR